MPSPKSREPLILGVSLARSSGTREIYFNTVKDTTQMFESGLRLRTIFLLAEDSNGWEDFSATGATFAGEQSTVGLAARSLARQLRSSQ